MKKTSYKLTPIVLLGAIVFGSAISAKADGQHYQVQYANLHLTSNNTPQPEMWVAAFRELIGLVEHSVEVSAEWFEALTEEISPVAEESTIILLADGASKTAKSYPIPTE